MAQLLKITKKSCLKIFRKMTPFKPMSAIKLEEEDEIFNDNPDAPSHYEEPSLRKTQYTQENETSNQKCNFKENNPVQDYETSSAYEADVENLSLTDIESNTMLQSLTTRLFLTSDGYEFQRLEQPRGDTVSDEIVYEPEIATHSIVFEKVRYKKHIRYFRRTPSNLSLDNVDDNKHNESTPNADPLTDPPKRTRNAAEAKRSHNGGSMRQPPAVQSFPQNIPAYVPINVMKLEIKNPGKFESVVIAEQRDRFDKLMPVVKWDINGNSLDDDFYIDDSWNDSTDMNWNNSSEKRVSQFKLDSESQKSSFRSSSTTLETWLDEDLLGGSLNERRQFAGGNLCRSKV
ncbi:uncharacterized protein LOC126756053 isoform X1 [Bactrocera neohumeralis]|uniref:uncharacterized protein LOC126756053 isoform X1 n=2 Tax=Bactrocera neohumeralis TaxID=98809 RepID=UPI002166474A|nr:uncharacterized protein LOC126756053 isoform X1 [Bactrocera neohumeralis]